MEFEIKEFDKAEKVKKKVEYRVLITNDDGAVLDGGTYKTYEDAETAIALIEGN